MYEYEFRALSGAIRSVSLIGIGQARSSDLQRSWETSRYALGYTHALRATANASKADVAQLPLLRPAVA